MYFTLLISEDDSILIDSVAEEELCGAYTDALMHLRVHELMVTSVTIVPGSSCHELLQ